MERVYFVQPYESRASRIIGRPVRSCASAEAARKLGARMAVRCSGVVVGWQDYDAASGRGGRPQVLALHGSVPEGWTAVSRAA